MTRPVIQPSTSQAAICDVPKPRSLDHTAIAYTIHVGTLTIRHVHASGRYNAPVADVAAYHRALLGKYRPALLTATEAEEPGLVHALRKALGRRYGIRKVGEYLCVVDRLQAWHRPQRRPTLHQLTHVPGLPDWRNLFIGDFRIRPLAAPWVRYVVTIGHVASGVEHGNQYRTDRPAMVAANRDGLAAWGRYLNQLPSAAVCVAAMDSNLNQHDPAWRQRVAHSLGGPTIWDHHQPPGGTHAGNRLIDTAVVRHGGSTTKENHR